MVGHIRYIDEKGNIVEGRCTRCETFFPPEQWTYSKNGMGPQCPYCGRILRLSPRHRVDKERHRKILEKLKSTQ